MVQQSGRQGGGGCSRQDAKDTAPASTLLEVQALASFSAPQQLVLGGQHCQHVGARSARVYTSCPLLLLQHNLLIQCSTQVVLGPLLLLTGRLDAVPAPLAYRSWQCSLCNSMKLLSTKKLKPMAAGMRRRFATASPAGCKARKKEKKCSGGVVSSAYCNVKHVTTFAGLQQCLLHPLLLSVTAAEDATNLAATLLKFPLRISVSQHATVSPGYAQLPSPLHCPTTKSTVHQARCTGHAARK